MKRGIPLVILALAATSAPAQQKAEVSGQGAAPLPQPQAAADVAQPANTNPALLYWQAIAMLPDISAEEIKMISEVLSGAVKPQDARVDGLLQRTRKSLDRFARAAASPAPCVWGTTFDEGPFAPLPHLPKLQLLCRLALTRSAFDFSHDRAEGALQWILHVHRAARHAAADRLLTTFVMQHGIEQQAIRLTARHVMALDAATRQQHLAILKSIGPPSTLRDALDGERTISEYLMRMVVGMEQTAVDEKVLLETADKLLRAEADKAEHAAPGSAQPALAMVEQWKLTVGQSRAMHTALEAASLKPWPAFEKDMQQIRLDLAAAPPSVLGTLQGVSGAKRKELETQTLHLMLETALTQGDALTAGEITGTKDAFFGDPLIVSSVQDTVKISMKASVRSKVLTLELK